MRRRVIEQSRRRVAHRTDQRGLIYLFGQQRHDFSEIDAGHHRFDGLELAAHIRGCVRLRVPNVNMTGATLQEYKDDALGPAPTALLPRVDGLRLGVSLQAQNIRQADAEHTRAANAQKLTAVRETVEKRLGALQAQKGQSNWAALLPELALVINTTTSRALPHHKIPFEVWFGRKPHWITAGLMEDADEVDIYDETDAESDDDGDFVLTEIEARVVANNTRLHAQMIKANSGQSALFIDGLIVTLQIPPKLWLATEPSRLLVQVLEYKNGQYKLQC